MVWSVSGVSGSVVCMGCVSGVSGSVVCMGCVSGYTSVMYESLQYMPTQWNSLRTLTISSLYMEYTGQVQHTCTLT